MISPSRSKMTASTVPNSADIWDRPTDVSRTVLLTIRVPGSHRQRTSGSLAGPCPVDCPGPVPARIGTDAPAVRALEAPLLAARPRARTPPRVSLDSSRVEERRRGRPVGGSAARPTAYPAARWHRRRLDAVRDRTVGDSVRADHGRVRGVDLVHRDARIVGASGEK